MFRNWKSLTMAGILVALVGCSHDRPHENGRERPPVDEIDPRDKGLQSMDVVAASDKMAASLLARPELNASKVQWAIVIDRVEDLTRDHTFRTDYQIFLERLRVNLSKQGHGRVLLIENKNQFYDLRNRELEGGGRDDFRQGAGGQPAAPQAIQPDFSLYLKAMDMPNRATNYYMLEFALTDLHNRVQVWLDDYEIRATR
jgi:hypothetical protein